MKIILFLLLLIVAFLMMCVVGNTTSNKTTNQLRNNLCYMVMLTVCLFGILILLSDIPRAIDVYRGKTDLQITSVNGIPKDSTVVWKN
jgi:undecaprenyl pyrophosphate phosphatase UppP